MMILRFVWSKAIEERGAESAKEWQTAEKRGQDSGSPFVIHKIVPNGLGQWSPTPDAQWSHLGILNNADAQVGPPPPPPPSMGFASQVAGATEPDV